MRVVPGYAVVFDRHFRSAPSMLVGGGAGQVPFDIALAGNKGNVVEIDDLD